MVEPKKYIPQFIKFPLWYLFKSPQRKINPYSVFYDLFGIFLAGFLSVFKFYKLKPISICVGIYNRSDLFLKYFIPSLAKASKQHLIELSVLDCGSNDIEDLENEIKKLYKGKLIYKTIKQPFSRAFAFNIAVKQSTNSKIFICDADFSIPENIVDLVNRFTQFGCIWFPIVFYLYKNKPPEYAKKNGEWMLWGGKGILACNKHHFFKVGMLDEKYKQWGFEDEDLWLRFHKQKFVVIRTRCKKLLHHWHKSLNPKYQALENK
ncbi:MAG: glycosyltransferase family 2 protein [Bacteroidia bacterium]